MALNVYGFPENSPIEIYSIKQISYLLLHLCKGGEIITTLEYKSLKYMKPQMRYSEII